MKPIVIIPAYQPGPELEELIKALSADPDRGIIIVDDGSSIEHAHFFPSPDKFPNVHLLKHAVNLGKGQALKTAFNYFLTTFQTDCQGVVTADADGQHLPADIKAVSRSLVENPTALYLGTRKFNAQTPKRSLFGNSLTHLVFRIFAGQDINDTQTGLRAIPRAFLKELLRIPAQGYDFELEMLLLAVRNRMQIKQLPIQTVYIRGNEKSHFNPILDSLRIYFVFLRFSAASLATAAVDYAVFTAIYFFSRNIFLSIVAARIIAGTMNFILGKKLVFKSKGSALPEIFRYAALVAFFMLVSYGLVTSLVVFLGLGVFTAKLLAETGLFLASFAAQDSFVFTKGKPPPQAAVSKPTDWDSYYSSPSLFAPLTRKVSGRLFAHLIDKFLKKSATTHLCELGGANSCLFSTLTERYPAALYTVIDTNRKGLDLLKARSGSSDKVVLLEKDILSTFNLSKEADLVFSAGLIEHFTPKDTAKAIRAHFSCARKDGLVIISFPTPTWLYCAIRKFAELIGVWIFHDERPLAVSAVQREMARYGEILHSSINWKIGLTQGIIAARAYRSGTEAAPMAPGEV